MNTIENPVISATIIVFTNHWPYGTCGFVRMRTYASRLIEENSWLLPVTVPLPFSDDDSTYTSGKIAKIEPMIATTWRQPVSRNHFPKGRRRAGLSALGDGAMPPTSVSNCAAVPPAATARVAFRATVLSG